MKKILPAVICLSMAVSASANGEMKDGWLIIEDFEAQPSVTTHNFQPGNGQTAVLTFIDDPAGKSGKVLSEVGPSWQEIVELTVTLPSGKTIADYDQIAFDYYSTKISYKNIKVMADNAEIFYSSNYSYATSTKKWLTFTSSIPENVTSGNTFKLRFGVDSGESGSEFYYDNVRLLPKPTTVGETKNGTLEGDTYYVEDFEASTPGAGLAVRNNTKGTVVENISGSGLVAKIVNSGWEALPQFSVKMPAGKTLANVKYVKFDIYVPTGLDTQPSDPTFKQRHIAINGTEVYRDLDENGNDTYPNSDAADKWATVSLELDKQGKLTDAMKALTEFELAVGINDNKITFYIDNLRFAIEDNTEIEDPSPYGILMSEIDYVSSFTNPPGEYRTIIKGEENIATDYSKVKSVAVASGVKATVYRNGVEYSTVSVTDYRNNSTDLTINFDEPITEAGEYIVVVPADCATFTMKDGSTVKNPKMYNHWTVVEKPCKGTKEDPFEDFSFFRKIAKESNYNFVVSPENGESNLWYKVYVVGWVGSDMVAHFDSDAPKTYYAVLLADNVNETDMANCILSTAKAAANLYNEGEHGKDTFHKYYLTRCSQVYSSSNKANVILGGINKTDKYIIDPGQSGIDAVGTDYESATVTVYNLQGMQVMRDAPRENLSTLPAGLYIVNGRKMVIR